MSPRVLITGGSGFVGRYCCERLVAEGTEVVVLDLVAPDWTTPAVTYVRGDVRDPVAVRRAMAGADAVLHLAAAHHDFGLSERTFYDVNETGTRVVCDAMGELGVARLCFTSSVAVYGDAPAPRDESQVPQPTSPYGGSKLGAEAVVRSWADAGPGRRALVVRPAVIFGPRNMANMYSLIRQIDSGLFAYVGDGRNVKSIAYIDNLVDALFTLWARPDAPAYDVFNYADKPDLSSLEIAEALRIALGRRRPPSVPLGLVLASCAPFDLVIKLTGRNLPVSSARVRKLFASETRFAADKLRRACPPPRVSLREGLARMAAWYRSEGHALPVRRHLPPAVVVRADDAVSLAG